MKYIAGSLCFIGASMLGTAMAFSPGVGRQMEYQPLVVFFILMGLILICLGISDDYFGKKKE